MSFKLEKKIYSFYNSLLKEYELREKEIIFCKSHNFDHQKFYLEDVNNKLKLNILEFHYNFKEEIESYEKAKKEGRVL